jgi:toxin-antitoxin system PIN domain toxin
VIAVDTNILVYAHREDSAWHDAAYATVEELAEGRSAWAIPWPCIHEFLAIVTHPRIYSPPTPVMKALEQVQSWLESPKVVLLAETDEHLDELRRAVQSAKVVGPQIHDARVAAICIHHGVRELWSADRDFGRFSGLSVKNPLVS